MFTRIGLLATFDSPKYKFKCLLFLNSLYFANVLSNQVDQSFIIIIIIIRF